MQSLMSWPQRSRPARAERTGDPLLERAIARPHASGDLGITLPGASEIRRLSMRRLRRIESAHRRKARPWRLVVVLFVAASATYGLWSGGELQRLFDQAHNGIGALAVAAGLGAQTIVIEGQDHVANAQIARALGVKPDTVLFTYNTDAAQRRLEQIPWIKRAEVMRLLPSTLQVVIHEHTPYAIWQNKGVTYVVDRKGKVLAPAARQAYPKLPIVVGQGAAIHAASLFRTLQRFPAVDRQLLAAIRVGDRRWNLMLTSGITLLLPSDDVAAALQSLLAVDRQHGLLDRNLASIDLRLSDRITVRLNDKQARPPAGIAAVVPPNNVPTASTRPTTMTTKGNT